VVLKGALAASGECQWGASLDLSMDNPRIEKQSDWTARILVNTRNGQHSKRTPSKLDNTKNAQHSNWTLPRSFTTEIGKTVRKSALIMGRTDCII